MSIIKISNLTKHYLSGGETVAALRGVDLDIAAGEFVTIMGHSGSGKSTLLSILGGMSRPTAGEMEMTGVKLYELPGERLADFRARKLGFVFQSFHLIPYLTALENVMLPLAIAKQANREKRDKAEGALARVGLAGKTDRLPSQLSGGEQERVAIARAVVNEPPIILADEPTGCLDTQTGCEVMELLRALNKDGLTVLVVTHNPDNTRYVDRTIRLRDGRIEADEHSQLSRLSELVVPVGARR